MFLPKDVYGVLLHLIKDYNIYFLLFMKITKIVALFNNKKKIKSIKNI